MLEEKISYQDLLSLLEETKEKVLVMLALKDLSGSKETIVSSTMHLGLKLVKNDRVPENMVFFTWHGELKRIEKWDLK